MSDQQPRLNVQLSVNPIFLMTRTTRHIINTFYNSFHNIIYVACLNKDVSIKIFLSFLGIYDVTYWNVKQSYSLSKYEDILTGPG